MKCPVCGGSVYWGLDCPGWGDPVMSCHPPCGNTETFECNTEGCKWWYAITWRRGDMWDVPMGAPPVGFETRGEDQGDELEP
jgi:hypothetical protein